MNSTLMGVAIAFVVALFAALIAPFLIDWSAYRGYVESRIGEILGRQVTIEGDLDVRLLPQPILRAETIKAGDGERPDITIHRLDMTMSLAPLLSGEVEVTQASVVSPTVYLSIDDAGRLTLGAGGAFPVDPESVSLETIEIRDGLAVIDNGRTGREHRIEKINLNGTAASLNGPFRAEGTVVHGDALHTVRFQTGKVTPEGKLRSKLAVIPADEPISFDSDGVLALQDGMLGFEGQVRLERLLINADGETAPEWRIDAVLQAADTVVQANKVEIAIGDPASGISLEGEGTLDLTGDPKMVALLSTRQIDLDKHLGGGEPLAWNGLGGQLQALLARLQSPLAVQLELDVGGIVAGGTLYEALSMAAHTTEKGWEVSRFKIEGPGDARIALSGVLTEGAQTPAFAGSVALRARTANAFLVAVTGSGELPGLGRISGPVDASGDVAISAEETAISSLSLHHTGGEINGEFRVSQPDDGRAQLTIALKADQLDADGLGKLFDDLASSDAGLDIDARLDAGNVSAKGIDLGHVVLDLRYDGERFELADFALDGLSGARISGLGALDDLQGTPSGQVSVDFELAELEGLRALGAALGQEEATEQIAQRAGVLLPARGTLEIAAQDQGAASQIDLRLSGTGANGPVGLEAAFTGTAEDWRNGSLAASFSAENPNSAVLLSLLGQSAAFLEAEPGTLTLSVDGTPATGMQSDLRFSGNGINLSGAGQVLLADSLVFDGVEFAASATDGALAAAAFGIRLAGETESGPARLRGTLGGTLERLSLQNLSGNWRDNDLTGFADIDRTVPGGRVTGKIQVDRADFDWIGGATLGAESMMMGNATLPQVALQPEMQLPFALDGDVVAASMALPGGLEARNVAFNLSAAEGVLRFSQFQGSLFGGSLTGSMAMTPGEAGAALEVDLQLKSARMEDFVWTRNGRPVASGSFNGALVASGNGRSLSGILAGLGGQGSISLENGRIEGINPSAFDEIVVAADAGLELDEEKVRDVFTGHLAAGHLAFDRVDGAFSIAGGVIRAERVSMDTQAVNSFVSGRIALDDFTTDAVIALSTATDEDREEGRQREAALVFSGPLAAPERRIDVAALMGYLTVRAFEQEVERLEQLQSDINERQRFSRELIRLGQERRKREDAVEAQQEAERQEAARQEAARREAARREAERKAQEEAARQAEEAARAAAEAEAAQQSDLDEPQTFSDEIQRVIDSVEPSPTPDPNTTSRVDPDPENAAPQLPAPVTVSPGNSGTAANPSIVSQPPASAGPQPNVQVRRNSDPFRQINRRNAAPVPQPEPAPAPPPPARPRVIDPVGDVMR